MKQNLFVITGPSGAGEDSVIQGLEKDLALERIITSTTRDMRDGESQGNPYYFLSHEEFQKKLANDEFFEHAELDRGKCYGVTHEEIERAKATGNIVIWKLDYKGAINARRLIPDIPIIYIYAPPEVIAERIKKRDNASDEFITTRLEYAKGWYDNEDIFDHKVENKDGKLDETVEAVKKIIQSYQ